MEPYDDVNVSVLDPPTFELTQRPETRDAISQTNETRRDVTPPVHSGPNVITAQPQGDVPPQRRPIPISSLDWVSTPRPQFSALSGTHFLGNVEQLQIQQIVDLSTLLGRSDKGFQYRVKIPKAETLFLAMETKPENRQSFLGCSRFIRGELSVNVIDQCGETAFSMRINSKWTYTFTKLHKITVGSTDIIGTVEENFSLLGPSFTVYDETRRERCNIFGPNICGCCMYKEALFQVVTMDGSHQIASLMHQWDNTLHEYILLITFPMDTDMKLKGLLLGAAFLIEYLYFEKIGRNTRRA